MPEPTIEVSAVAAKPKTAEANETDRAEQLRERRRLMLLVLVTIGAAVLATACLLAQFNVNAILYKGF